MLPRRSCDPPAAARAPGTEAIVRSAAQSAKRMMPRLISVAAADSDPRDRPLVLRPLVLDFDAEFDRLATHLTVLDVARRSAAEIHHRLEGLPAVGALHGARLQRRGGAGGRIVSRLDHRLQAVELVHIPRTFFARRHPIHSLT